MGSFKKQFRASGVMGLGTWGSGVRGFGGLGF